MKTLKRLISLYGELFFVSTVVNAQVGGHYPAGVEGIKGASLPPPGLYFGITMCFIHQIDFEMVCRWVIPLR
jgi:hypothetical protein